MSPPRRQFPWRGYALAIAAAALLSGCGGSSSSASHSSTSSVAASSSGQAVRQACLGVQTSLTESARDVRNRASVGTIKVDLRQVQAAFDALRPSIGSQVRATFNLAEGEYTASIQSLIAQQSGRGQDAQRQARIALLLRQRINTTRADPFSVCRQKSVRR